MDTSKQSAKGGNGAPKRQPKPVLTDVKDFVQVGIIAVYLVQRMGKPTLAEMQEVIQTRLHANIGNRILKRALQGAAKRGIVAVLQTRQDDGGANVDCFSLKIVGIWKQPPEYAHILDLLDKLLRTPEAEQVKKWFDGSEKATSPKKARGNVIDEYHAYAFTGVTLTEIIGSQIACPHTDSARQSAGAFVPGKKDDSKKKKDEKKDEESVMEGIFMVDALTGDYIIPPDVMLGWFKTNAARYCGMADSRAEYIAFEPVRIHNPKVTQLVLPVNGPRGVSAPKSFECISPGAEFTVHFLAPTKGWLKPEQLEKLVVLAGLRPRRGISPARGRRYGSFLVTSFEDKGPVKEGGIDHLKDNIPKGVMDLHGQYLEQASDRLRTVNFAFGDFAGTDEGSQEPFPLSGESSNEE